MSKTKMLRATKPLKYLTRHLVPGEVFEADKRYVTAFLASRKAVLVREPAVVPPPPPAVAEKIAAVTRPVIASNTTTDAALVGNAPPSDQGEKINTPADDLAAARTAYREAFGKAPFHTWDAATLRAKIAAKVG